MTAPALTRAGVTLRPFRPDDFAGLHAVLSDPEVMRFSLAGPFSEERTRAYLAGCIADHARDGVGLFAVTLPAAGVVGYCGFKRQPVAGQPEIEISYRLHRSVWGRGIATVAAAVVRDRGFAHHGFPRLIAMIEPANVASVRVAEKIGLRRWRQDLYAGRIPVDIYALERPGGGPANLAAASPSP